MKNIKFQYYESNIYKQKALGFVSLERFLTAIKQPKQKYIDLFAHIAQCEANNDMKTKGQLKEKLFSFTPCVHVSEKRKYDHITQFTGLLVLDFDHIDNAPEFKDYLFNDCKSIIACWLSPSKRGIKALVKIPVVNSIQQFKQYYFGIATEMYQYNGFDESGQNCVLPLFQSYDTELLYRDDPKVWTVKGKKLGDLDTLSTTTPTPIQPTCKHEQTIFKIIDTAFSNITDFGHPPLRGICLSIGGYVANGYIDKHTAISYINNKILSHSYLRQKAKAYIKTVDWAINRGMYKPHHLSFSSM